MLRLLHKLHKNLGHPSGRVLQKLLLRKGTQPWVAKLALHLVCDVCKQWDRKPMHPIVDPHDPALPLDSIAMDGFDWVHPISLERVRGTLFVDDGSGKTKSVIHKVTANRGATGNTSKEEAGYTFVHHWISSYERPFHVRTYPEGCFR